MLVFTVWQSESAICIHISTSSDFLPISFPPEIIEQSSLCSLLIYFIHSINSVYKVKVKVLVTQLCLTLCDSMDWSPQVSSAHGILQARILEWVARLSTRGSSQPRNPTHISHLLHWQPGSLPLVPPGKPQVFSSNILLSHWCVTISSIPIQ